MKVAQALISVSDKHGVVDFARELDTLGVNIPTLRAIASRRSSRGSTKVSPAPWK